MVDSDQRTEPSGVAPTPATTPASFVVGLAIAFAAFIALLAVARPGSW